MIKTDAHNPCTETTCKNGGTCYSDSLMKTKCFCEESFDGIYCEIERRTTITSKPYDMFNSKHS